MGNSISKRSCALTERCGGDGGRGTSMAAITHCKVRFNEWQKLAKKGTGRAKECRTIPTVVEASAAPDAGSVTVFVT